eukprot:533678-Rhodomonas_salina.2
MERLKAPSLLTPPLSLFSAPEHHPHSLPSVAKQGIELRSPSFPSSLPLPLSRSLRWKASAGVSGQLSPWPRTHHRSPQTVAPPSFPPSPSPSLPPKAGHACATVGSESLAPLPR